MEKNHIFFMADAEDSKKCRWCRWNVAEMSLADWLPGCVKSGYFVAGMSLECRWTTKKKSRFESPGFY